MLPHVKKKNINVNNTTALNLVEKMHQKEESRSKPNP